MYHSVDVSLFKSGDVVVSRCFNNSNEEVFDVANASNNTRARDAERTVALRETRQGLAVEAAMHHD